MQVCFFIQDEETIHCNVQIGNYPKTKLWNELTDFFYTKQQQIHAWHLHVITYSIQDLCLQVVGLKASAVHVKGFTLPVRLFNTWLGDSHLWWDIYSNSREFFFSFALIQLSDGFEPPLFMYSQLFTSILVQMYTLQMQVILCHMQQQSLESFNITSVAMSFCIVSLSNFNIYQNEAVTK